MGTWLRHRHIVTSSTPAYVTDTLFTQQKQAQRAAVCCTWSRLTCCNTTNASLTKNSRIIIIITLLFHLTVHVSFFFSCEFSCKCCNFHALNAADGRAAVCARGVSAAMHAYGFSSRCQLHNPLPKKLRWAECMVTKLVEHIPVDLLALSKPRFEYRRSVYRSRIIEC